MVNTEKLKAIPYFAHLPEPLLSQLAKNIDEVEFDQNDFIIRQHDESRFIYLLLSGTLQYLITFQGVDDLLVGTNSRALTLIGWSAFRPPFRHTASVRCETPCRALKVSKETLEKMFTENPKFGYIFLRKFAATLAGRLEQTRNLMIEPKREQLAEEFQI